MSRGTGPVSWSTLSLDWASGSPTSETRNADFEILDSGYFVWLALPAPLDAVKVAVRAKEKHDLIIAPGAMFGVKGDDDAVNLKGKVRLCFAWEQESSLEEGIKRLSRVIREAQDELDRHGTEVRSRSVEWADSKFR